MNFKPFAIFALDELEYKKFDKVLCYESNYEQHLQIVYLKSQKTVQIE